MIRPGRIPAGSKVRLPQSREHSRLTEDVRPPRSQGWVLGTATLSSWAAVIVASAVVGLAILRLDPCERESTVAPNQLPPLVARAVEARFPGARLADAARVTSGAASWFEVMLQADGRTVRASFTSAGVLRECEVGLHERDLPAAVQAGLSASAQAHWPIRSVEFVERPNDPGRGLYEVTVEQHAVTLELAYDDEGRRGGARRTYLERGATSAHAE